MSSKSVTQPPSVSAHSVVLGGEGADMPEDTPRVVVRGYDFNKGVNFDEMMACFATSGFQATNIAGAINEINRMRSWRLSDDFPVDTNEHTLDFSTRQQIRAKIFLAYTSNQISSGQREVIRYLVQHSMVDVLVTTAGGIEEDLIKCLNPTYIGSFKHRGKELRSRGINRIGNLYLPNKNYCDFEDWILPILHKMHDEQEDRWTEYNGQSPEEKQEGSQRFIWTPSSFISRLGVEINNEDSVLYWAAKNNIPVFCPALTDGSIGDMIYFYSYKRPGFVLDIVQDVRNINDEAVRAYATGMIILGGGVVKHHTSNANLMRNGADFAVFINTGQEFDGSDAGAAPDEAISWGKIRINAKPVKVCAEATVVFPLIVSQTFAKNVQDWKTSTVNSMCWL